MGLISLLRLGPRCQNDNMVLDHTPEEVGLIPMMPPLTLFSVEPPLLLLFIEVVGGGC